MAVRKTGESIRVMGLREVRRALKEAADRSPRELQQANKQAAEVVVRAARARAPAGPHQGGGNVAPLRASIKAQATAGRGIIAFGGARSPHGPPIEFGGTLRRHASASRTSVVARPYIYPAITASRDEVLDTYERALRDITRNL